MQKLYEFTLTSNYKFDVMTLINYKIMVIKNKSWIDYVQKEAADINKIIESNSI